jgi:two-component system chemotaxis response regulator CheB
MTSRRIRVLVVDDSAVVRRLVSEALAADPELEVVGTAIDPYVARDKIVALSPDVLTLDLEMPRMDGLTFLRILMEQRPMPVIVMSSLTWNGSEHALEALRIGAVDVLGKPGGAYSFGDLGPQLVAKVKAAAGARLRPFRAAVMPAPALPTVSRAEAEGPAGPGSHPTGDPRRLILLGASTGGTEALRAVLTCLPAGLPPIAIVQHIPAVFSRAFAERLNQLCAFPVAEAKDGDLLLPGRALVAPGNFHMLIQWLGNHYRVRVTDGPPVWHQRPAVDLLFKSAVDAGAGPQAVAGVLTGMGKDGAEGLLRLRDSGAATFAQDEASCIVYGMPRVAWETGAAQRQVALDRIPEFLCQQPEFAGAAHASLARAPS